MRLIDADKLMKELGECFYDTTNLESRRAAYDTMELCKNLIDEQPTAYDVDKVAEQIKDMHFDFQVISADKYKVLKIVESGGIE